MEGLQSNNKCDRGSRLYSRKFYCRWKLAQFDYLPIFSWSMKSFFSLVSYFHIYYPFYVRSYLSQIKSAVWHWTTGSYLCNIHMFRQRNCLSSHGTFWDNSYIFYFTPHKNFTILVNIWNMISPLFSDPSSILNRKLCEYFKL